MNVEYIATTSEKLSELSVVNGQLIYLSDLNASYYDMGGTRRLMSSMRLVPALPSTALAQEGVVYGIVNASGYVDATVWDASASTYRSLSGYVATASSLGLVRPDGTTITIDQNGVISCTVGSTLPATSVIYDNTLSGLSATNAQAAIDEVNTLTEGASASASSALAEAQSASTAAANASTAAAAAQGTADTAQQTATAATTAVAGVSTRVTDLESFAATVVTRLAALEAVAEIALTTE